MRGTRFVIVLAALARTAVAADGAPIADADLGAAVPDDATVVEAVPAAPAAPPPAPRFVVAIGAAISGVVFLGKQGDLPAATVTPNERTLASQAFGVGYIVNRRVAVMLSAVFIETVYAAAGPRAFSFGGVTPWAMIQLGHSVSLGVGPMLWYRTFGATQLDYGAYLALGYSIKLPRRFGLTLSVASPQAYGGRFAAAVGGGVGLSRRF